LKLNQQQIDEFGESIPHEARVMMNPGKNFDGWWNVEKLIDQ
ncbi:15084_t:CDS:1, partial [Entrophospora sp. SA101]